MEGKQLPSAEQTVTKAVTSKEITNGEKQNSLLWILYTHIYVQSDIEIKLKKISKNKCLFNLSKPTGYVMHQQFNIQQLYALPTLYLCVLYLSENKQRLVPLTA